MTRFYDPAIAAIRDPAARELLSRLQGRCDQLQREQDYVKNVAEEIRERLTWMVQLPGSPFEVGDRVAKEIAAATREDRPLKLEAPEPPLGA